ncbi:MAG: TRAP transporter fused permease subunit [Spirochaetes bacterium]|nr:TRAP transporter fused permease subunit [Spirochaetota bacterium]
MSGLQQTQGLSPSKSLWEKTSDVLILAIAVGMALFHLYAASFGTLIPYLQTTVHWAFVGSYIVLSRPLKFPGGRIIDIALILLTVFFSYYVQTIQARPIQFTGIFSQTDVRIAIGAVILAMFIAYRVLGLVLPVICAVFIAYGLLGHQLAGLFNISRFSVSRVFTTIFADVSTGMYGQTLFVSAQFIFLFVLFGSLLGITGAGNFFVDLAFSLTGKTRGGPAQAAVFSSMLMGTINGSGAANVVTTGNFTIPLMKKVGYRPSMAGAIEAVASSGGQIMPPVMGAVAFLMSEVTGIPYVSIALAALIPATLYFVTISATVYLTARKENIPAAKDDELKKFTQVLKSGWLYLAPLIVLITLLLANYSVRRSAFFAIVVTLLVGLIKNPGNMRPANLARALKDAMSGIAPIAAACILAGMIMAIINLTGLGLRISGIIVDISAGHLLLALALSMITSLILGMGLPTAAAYMILAVLVAPALIRMGATPMSAHLFILYFGALSTITPPVALSVFAAAGIAKAGIWSTGRDAIFLASTGFIIPFAFVYHGALLMDGSFLMVLWASVTAAIGCIILSLAITGWGGINLNLPARLALLPCAVALILPEPVILNFAGLGLACGIVVLCNYLSKIKGAKTWAVTQGK